MANQNLKFNYLKAMIIGGIGGLLSFLASWFITFFRIPSGILYDGEFVRVTGSLIDIDLRTQVVEAGYFRQIGLAILNFVQNNLGLDVWTFFGVIFGGVIVYLVGRIAFAFLVKKRNKFLENTRVWISWLFGFLVASVLVPPIFGVPWGIFPSMLAYGLIIGGLMQFLVSWKSLKFITE